MKRRDYEHIYKYLRRVESVEISGAITAAERKSGLKHFAVCDIFIKFVA